MRSAFLAVLLLSSVGVTSAASNDTRSGPKPAVTDSDTGSHPQGAWHGGGSHGGTPGGAPPSGTIPATGTGGGTGAPVHRLPGTFPAGVGGHGDWGGHHGGHDGDHDGDHHHHRGGGVIFFPYPFGDWYPPDYYYPPYPAYDYPDDADTDGRPPPDMRQAGRPFWYYCEKPDGFYPYVMTCTGEWSAIPISPPPPGAAPPISYADWQWCEEKKAFFPYVSACPSGFKPIPVTAPHTEGAPPSVANWYFCEDPKGYLPYVMECKKDWRPVPSVPPPSVPITVKQAKNP